MWMGTCGRGVVLVCVILMHLSIVSATPPPPPPLPMGDLNQTPHGWGLITGEFAARHLLLTTPSVKSPVRVLVETMVKSSINLPDWGGGGGGGRTYN